MRTLGTSRACIPHSRAGRKRSRTVPRTAARCVLICWIVVLGCLATACSQGSSVKQAASSLASSKGVTVTPTPPAATTPAATTTAPTATATVTAPPSTATVTAPATTAPAHAVATPATATPTGASESGSSLVWLWVALAAAAVVVIARIVSAGRRRTTARADWRTRLIDAYAKGSALRDAMVAAEAPGMLSSADAAVRWSDIQRRADDFGQTLYRLRESAADEDGVRIEAVLASLQAARSAMEAERSGQ